MTGFFYCCDCSENKEDSKRDYIWYYKKSIITLAYVTKSLLYEKQAEILIGLCYRRDFL